MAEPSPIEIVRALLTRAIAERLFPAAVVEVGSSSGVLWREAFGSLTFESPTVSGPRTDHLRSRVAREADRDDLGVPAAAGGRRDRPRRSALDLFSRVAWRRPRRRRRPGFTRTLVGPRRTMLDVPPEGRREFEHDICTMPLEYPRRAQSIYSDLGFILLGFALADRAATRSTFSSHEFSRGWSRAPGTRPVLRGIPGSRSGCGGSPRRDRTDAADGRRRAPRTNARGGSARQLRGRARRRGRSRRSIRYGACRWCVCSRRPPQCARRRSDFSAVDARAGSTRDQQEHGTRSSRGLGWDTMLPTSSCGSRLSPAAFGHPGFTGTSLWIDPCPDRYFVLLTNRVCGGGTPAEMRTVRRAFHDALSRL